MYYWFIKGLSKIVSKIGILMFVDRCIVIKERNFICKNISGG